MEDLDSVFSFQYSIPGRFTMSPADRRRTIKSCREADQGTIEMKSQWLRTICYRPGWYNIKIEGKRLPI